MAQWRSSTTFDSPNISFCFDPKFLVALEYGLGIGFQDIYGTNGDEVTLESNMVEMNEASVLNILIPMRQCKYNLRGCVALVRFFLVQTRTTQKVGFFCVGVGRCQDNGNRSNQKSKFDFLATRQQLGKIDRGQQKIKIVRSNRQSNLQASCQSFFSLSGHHPTRKCLVKISEGQQKIKIVRTNRQSNLRASCQSIFSLSRHHPSQCLVKIDEGQQKIKIVRTNRQSNLRGSCQSIFSLCRHHPSHH